MIDRGALLAWWWSRERDGYTPVAQKATDEELMLRHARRAA